MPGAVKS
jgi:hypothetical protein